MTNVEQFRLGFIEIVMFDDKSIRGGLLITDGDTYPYEFRVTTPIQATNIQRILYGAVYAEYVYEKLLGLPLLEGVKEKPDLILARTKQLLEIRPYIGCPMVLVKRIDNPEQGGW